MMVTCNLYSTFGKFLYMVASSPLLPPSPGWQWTGDVRCICVSCLRCFSFIMGWQRRNRAQDAFVSRALGMFFLLSFLLLLINDLHLDYLYRNHDDHDDEWPPSSQHKQGARTRYVLFFKNLLLFSLLNVYLQQTYHNGNEWPLLSLSAEWTQARDADVSWFQYVNFLYFFFSHHLIIIYRQTTCMEWQLEWPQ